MQGFEKMVPQPEKKPEVGAAKTKNVLSYCSTSYVLIHAQEFTGY